LQLLGSAPTHVSGAFVEPESSDDEAANENEGEDGGDDSGRSKFQFLSYERCRQRKLARVHLADSAPLVPPVGPDFQASLPTPPAASASPSAEPKAHAIASGQ